MGRVLDTLHENLGEIIAFPSIFLSEKYMMNIFSKYANELSTLKDYLQLMFNNTRMMVKNRTTGMRVAHLDTEKRELFNPKKKNNTKSTSCMLGIVFVGMPHMKKEIIDTRKATWRNLYKSGDQRSWEHSTKEDKIKTRECHATNDQSEINLGGTTRGIELGEMINIPRAAAQSDTRRNGFWNMPITARRGKKKNVRVAKCTFHQFCDEIQHCLIDVSGEDSHEQDKINDR